MEMKIKDLITVAEQMLGRQDYDILLRCANLVISNIAHNHVELVAKQALNVGTTGRINFSSLAYTPVRIKSVRIDGVNVAFDLFIGFIQLTHPPRHQTSAEITYAAAPELTSGDDSAALVFGNVTITPTTLLYGMLAEYAEINTMPDEQRAWREKFHQFLFGMKRDGRIRIIIGGWSA